MEGMDPAGVNSATGGDERLSGHLASEDPQAGRVEVLAAEDVHLDGLEVKQLDEMAQGLCHGSDDRLSPWPR